MKETSIKHDGGDYIRVLPPEFLSGPRYSGPETAISGPNERRGLGLHKQHIDGIGQGCTALHGNSDAHLNAHKTRPAFRKTCSSDQLEKIRAADRVRAKKRREENPQAHAAYARDYYHRQKSERPERVAARIAVQCAIKSGRLVPQFCEVKGCGKPGEAHHESYAPDKQLNVNWLCDQHHAQADIARRMRELRKAGKSAFAEPGDGLVLDVPAPAPKGVQS